MRAPEAVTIELRANEKAATKDGTGDDLPTFARHLYAAADGRYRSDVNDWETEVVTTESDRPSFVAWYRNPSRATPNALRIGYQDDAGAWTSLQVDFVIVSRRDDESLAASIVDPHGDHLADAKAKLHALAEFAELHGDRFIRIVSIARQRQFPASPRPPRAPCPAGRARLRPRQGLRPLRLRRGIAFSLTSVYTIHATKRRRCTWSRRRCTSQ